MDPNLTKVAASGDRRGTLEALRDTLATAISECESKRDLGALVRQMQSVMCELDALPDPTRISPSDRIAAARAARGR